MVIDTSAILALLFAEEEADRLGRAIAGASTRLVGAPTLAEASAVLVARKGPQADVALDAWLRKLDVEVVAFDAVAADEARRAYVRFGKGVGDPAVLNYGDCLSYGIAKSRREALLYKGDDFSGTDIEVAAW